MQLADKPHHDIQTATVLRSASKAAMASLLNLTLLPVIAFIWLLIQWRSGEKGGLAHYHVVLAIKLNIAAGFALGSVSVLMLALGGFDSVWTWVYLIIYFTLVHSIFIVFAVWTLVRAQSGQRLS